MATPAPVKATGRTASRTPNGGGADPVHGGLGTSASLCCGLGVPGRPLPRGWLGLARCELCLRLSHLARSSLERTGAFLGSPDLGLALDPLTEDVLRHVGHALLDDEALLPIGRGQALPPPPPADCGAWRRHAGLVVISPEGAPGRLLRGRIGVCANGSFFMHPPRGDFMATVTSDENAAFEVHAARLRRLLAGGTLIAAGPCLGPVNTGIAIFEAPDEEAARRIVAGEPVTNGRYMRGDLRPYRVGLLRGRD